MTRCLGGLLTCCRCGGDSSSRVPVDRLLMTGCWRSKGRPKPSLPDGSDRGPRQRHGRRRRSDRWDGCRLQSGTCQQVICVRSVRGGPRELAGKKSARRTLWSRNLQAQAFTNLMAPARRCRCRGFERPIGRSERTGRRPGGPPAQPPRTLSAPRQEPCAQWREHSASLARYRGTDTGQRRQVPMAVNIEPRLPRGAGARTCQRTG